MGRSLRQVNTFPHAISTLFVLYTLRCDHQYCRRYGGDSSVVGLRGRIWLAVLLTGAYWGTMSVQALAVPDISAVSGSLSDGSTVTIAGSDFGAKVQASPQL